MNTIAFLFPGQGSQSVGMGQDLFQEYDFVREIFDAADDLLGCRPKLEVPLDLRTHHGVPDVLDEALRFRRVEFINSMKRSQKMAISQQGKAKTQE